MNKKIILCGAGKIGSKLYEKLGEDEVFCFADNNKAGQTYCDKNVISISELNKIHSNYQVILSVSSVFADELREQLAKLGIGYIEGAVFLRKLQIQCGDYEEIESEGAFTRAFVAFCQTIKPQTFVNVGGASGGYASIAAHFMTQGAQIYIFEPIAGFYSTLSDIFADDDRVRIVNKAVSNQSGKMELFATVKPTTPGIAHSFTFDKQQTMFKDEYNEEFETIVETVEAVTIDELFADKEIDLMLMDIEGAELFAIEGMRELIAKRKTTLFLELHEPYIKSVCPDGMQRIEQVFRDNGYKFYWCEYDEDNYTTTRGGTHVVPVPNLRFEHCIIVPEELDIKNLLG